MSLKKVAVKQYQATVNRAAASIGRQRSSPPEGWIATVRKALGMSGVQLASRLGVKKARAWQTEKNELAGTASLQSMQAVAQAMGCRFIYAIGPAEGRIEEVIAAQAKKKAEALVARASAQMALEAQSLTGAAIRSEVKRLATELAASMASDLWTDE